MLFRSSNFRDDLEEPYINCSAVSFPKMFTTGSLGDYLGVPTRKSYYASSTNVTSSVSKCSSDSSKSVALIGPDYSWDSIISNLGFNKSLSDITGVSCSGSYDEVSTVLVKVTSILKIQRYLNANMRFDIINDRRQL